MPQTLHIALNPPPKMPLPRDCTHAVHRQVFVWLGQVNPPLAAAAHDGGHTQIPLPNDLGKQGRNFPSFTLSPADGRGGLDYDLHLLPEGFALYAQLCRGMTHLPFVEVDGQPIPLDHTRTKVTADCPYEALAAPAKMSREVCLAFRTPTLFTSKGKDVIQPDPVRVFKGYAERWNAFAPAALTIDLMAWEAWLTDYVSIAEMRIATQTRTWQRNKSNATERHIGFVGEVRFVAAAHAPAETLRRWCALADFANWCGTGRMAAQGLGCTKRL